MKPTFTKRYGTAGAPAVACIELLDCADSGTANICKQMQELQDRITSEMGVPKEMMEVKPMSTAEQIWRGYRMAAQSNDRI